MLVVRPTTAMVVRDQVFTSEEEFALAGFLAGYSGLTRDAYALDLRQYVQWCAERAVTVFGARRADIESFGRHLETRGRARATIARRLCTITCFYRFAEQEGLIATSPAVHVRRPRLDYESHATGLDRNEVGAMLAAAALGDPSDHALISLLALNGLRVSEATGADIERLGLERGHRPSPSSAKAARSSPSPRPGPPAPSTSPSANATKDRSSPAPITDISTVMPRAGSCAASPAKPGSPNGSAPTPSATRSSPPLSTQVSHYATFKKPPATPTHGPPCATTAPASPSTDTPPTSSQPSSQEQPDSLSPNRSGVAQAPQSGHSGLRAHQALRLLRHANGPHHVRTDARRRSPLHGRLRGLHGRASQHARGSTLEQPATGRLPHAALP
jgi:Phage integrase, N-terminal SAM-like domain